MVSSDRVVIFGTPEHGYRSWSVSEKPTIGPNLNSKSLSNREFELLKRTNFESEKLNRVDVSQMNGLFSGRAAALSLPKRVFWRSGGGSICCEPQGC